MGIFYSTPSSLSASSKNRRSPIWRLAFDGMEVPEAMASSMALRQTPRLLSVSLLVLQRVWVCAFFNSNRDSGYLVSPGSRWICRVCPLANLITTSRRRVGLTSDELRVTLLSQARVVAVHPAWFFIITLSHCTQMAWSSIHPALTSEIFAFISCPSIDRSVPISPRMASTMAAICGSSKCVQGALPWWRLFVLARSDRCVLSFSKYTSTPTIVTSPEEKWVLNVSLNTSTFASNFCARRTHEEKYFWQTTPRGIFCCS